MSNEKAKKIAALKAGLLEVKRSLDLKDLDLARHILQLLAEIVVELEEIERGEDEEAGV